ncbi:hypothetical protein ACJMK2_042347 [Sinanodonta woodiana]|uniref:RRM domain-containing protein n=2 Tax=Sinanodonta woodiana TaxID=1069815 RepID=A0ABD3W728_SINWO
MYVCYSYSYGHPGAANAPITLSPAVSASSPAITEPILVPISASPIQALPPTLSSTIPLAVCRKRGSDELMSHGQMVTNGAGLSPQQDINDAKKVKLDQNQAGPSRVVHIRSLPPDVVEADVVQLGIPFGKMTNILLLKQKNQAFLEFADEAAASTMVNYYSTNACTVGNKHVYVQFSNHRELRTDQSHSFQNATAQAALQAAQAVMVGNGGDEAKQRTTLRVIVEQLIYPVTIEVLYQIFSKFGKVLKMIIFTKNNTFQALIQFGDSVSANAAKLSLDGQNIYNGCCTLRIDWSKLNNLNIKYNNDKSRDFTNPNLPSGDPSIDQAMHLGGPGMGAGLAGQMPMQGFGLANPAAVNAAARLGLSGLTGSTGSGVLLVSNLDEQKVTPDALFTLFGVYGDVHRVKILFNKKDNALIQMAEPHQAQLAIAHLDKVRVWGKQIRVTQSKHALVQMPKEGQPDAGLTKDFTTSPLHRFKRPGSKNCQNIYPPSAVLHLSNIPANVTEDEVTELFSQHGTVRGFKFFQKDRKMALIQLDSVDEAVTSLIAMHNYPLSDANHLRVSFSKSTI